MIEAVYPELDGGRYAVKRVVGDTFEVWADIFRDGHDALGAALMYLAPGGEWREAPMRLVDNDRWRGSFALERIGRHLYTIEAWTDRFESWKRDFLKKRDAGQNVGLELAEVRSLVAEALRTAPAAAAPELKRAAGRLDAAASDAERAALMVSDPFAALMAHARLRGDPTRYHRELELYVDRKAARFAAWMQDTLDHIGRDPIYRAHRHHQLTFGLIYAFSENFILPLSHDEVVHGKRSLLGKMPGDRWQRFANLRAYYTFMFGHPGKKLLFMGAELAQEREWNHDTSLDWHLLADPAHAGVQRLVRDLNSLYRTLPALHARDCEPEGFEWIDANDAANSVLSFLRRAAPGGPPAVVVCNFTPVARHGYRIGVPAGGAYREALTSDAAVYGGSNVGNGGRVVAEPVPWHGRPFSLDLTLPPLGAPILVAEAG